MRKLYIPFKYLADFILSLFALIIFAPLFLVIAFVIKVTSKGPVFFKQKRIGKNCKIFYIHKFRTMRIDTPKDCPTHLLENPQSHITKVGKFLRMTSLDELPQIWDIFRGKMSIIGPRPALYNQEDLASEREKYGANSLRPGLTGLAQISGRDELVIPVKAKLDGDYVQNISIFLDIKIFFKTVFLVLRRKGVQEGKKDNSATAILPSDTSISASQHSVITDEDIAVENASIAEDNFSLGAEGAKDTAA